MKPPSGEHQTHTRYGARSRRDSDRMRSLAHMELVPDDEPIVRRTRRQVLADAFKRSIDFVGALALIVLLSPLLIVLAIAIKLDSRGPALFAHRRLGRGGKHFDCL